MKERQVIEIEEVLVEITKNGYDWCFKIGQIVIDGFRTKKKAIQSCIAFILNLSKEVIEELKTNFKKVTEENVKEKQRQHSNNSKIQKSKRLSIHRTDCESLGEAEQKVVSNGGMVVYGTKPSSSEQQQFDSRQEQFDSRQEQSDLTDSNFGDGKEYIDRLFGTTEDELEELERESEEIFNRIKDSVNRFVGTAEEAVKCAFRTGLEIGNRLTDSETAVQKHQIEPTTIDIEAFQEGQ